MAQASESYARDGYVICPARIPGDLLARVAVRMEAVRRGEYETGIAPMPDGDPRNDSTRLVKIDAS